MGLDLILLPYDCDQPRLQFSHTVLNCERRRDLFDELLLMEGDHGSDVADGFASYKAEGDDGESCYGVTTTTPYGDRLRYVEARHLKAFAKHDCVIDNFVNLAIWAYLEHLPDSNKVALYWN